MVEQGTSSLVSFAMTLALARWLVAEEFGAATLAITLSLMAQGLYRALVLEPASVLGPSRFGDDVDGYLRSVVRFHFRLTLVFSGLGALALVVQLATGTQSSLSLALSIAVMGLPAALALPLARTIAYIHARPLDSVVPNVAAGVAIGSFLLALKAMGSLGAASALGAISLGSAVGAALLLIRYGTGGTVAQRTVWQVHSRYGGVILLATATGVLANQLFVYLTGITLGLGAVGTLNALITIGAPTLPILNALGALAVPAMARAWGEDDHERVRRLARVAGLGAVGLSLASALVICLGAPMLERIAFGGRYQDNIADLRILAFYPVLTALSLWPSLILRAEQDNRHYLRVNLVMLPASAFAALMLQPRYGFRGAAVGMLFIAAVSAANVWFLRWSWDREGATRRRFEIEPQPELGFHGARLDRRRRVLPALLVVGAAACSFAAAAEPRTAAAMMAVVLVAPVFITRLSWRTALLVFVWSFSLVHLFKKSIYFLGPQPRLIYVGIVAIPVLLVCFLALRAPIVRGVNALPGRALLVYSVFSLVSSVLDRSGTSVAGRVSGVLLVIAPLAAYRVGLALPLDSVNFARFARSLVWSALVSVPYGLYILIAGPTPLERAWAYGAHDASIQARKVYNYIEGLPNGEWRGFSYHADPFSWGLFLVVGLFMLFVVRNLRSGGALSRIPLWIPVSLFLFGLLGSLSRSPWLGATAAAGMFVLLGLRPARRPVFVYATAIVGLVLVLNVGSYLYQQVFPEVNATIRSQNLVIARYFNLGSVEARLGAWDQLPKVLGANPIVGQGRGRALEQQQIGRGELDLTQISHNFLVEVALIQGGVALIAQLVFLGVVIRSGIRLVRTNGDVSRTARLLVSLIFGLVMTGYTNGTLFMNEVFFVLCGVVVATERSVATRRAMAQIQPPPETLARERVPDLV